MKTVDFSEAIAACDLKVGRYRQLVIDLMKVCAYLRSRSCSYEKNAFLKNHLAVFNQILYKKFWIYRNENLLT